MVDRPLLAHLWNRDMSSAKCKFAVRRKVTRFSTSGLRSVVRNEMPWSAMESSKKCKTNPYMRQYRKRHYWCRGRHNVTRMNMSDPWDTRTSTQKVAGKPPEKNNHIPLFFLFRTLRHFYKFIHDYFHDRTHDTSQIKRTSVPLDTRDSPVRVLVLAPLVSDTFVAYQAKIAQTKGDYILPPEKIRGTIQCWKHGQNSVMAKVDLVDVFDTDDYGANIFTCN